MSQSVVLFFFLIIDFSHEKILKRGVVSSVTVMYVNPKHEISHKPKFFVALYCRRSAHSALHKRNTQPILTRSK